MVIAERPPSRPLVWLKRHAPGLMACGAIAALSFWCEEHLGGPAALYAMAYSMIAMPLLSGRIPGDGIAFASRPVLRTGVALLGLKISIANIIAIGPVAAGLVMAAMAAVMFASQAIARRLGLSSAFGAVSATSVSVCGVSAALTAASVMPAGRVRDQEVAMVCLTVTVLSTLAMAIYPALAQALDLGSRAAGVFLGGSIHDVAQVVAAGFILGEPEGQAATITKLFRVALLGPITVGLAIVFQRAAAASAGGAAGLGTYLRLPWFLWVFLGLVAVRSTGLVPEPLSEAASQVSRVCLVLAVAAIGLKTGLAALREAGWRPLLLILIQTFLLGAIVLAGAALIV
jgi:uncharacterized integral membrane protein (TIGR00698 family)